MAAQLNRIIHGDCIKEMGKLKAGSVDLVFADPPFNIGYDYDEYDDKRSCEDYLDWSKRWMSEVKRVLKPDGTFWLAIGDEYAAELKVMATRELGLTCRSWVIWYYTFGVHCTHKFTRSHVHLFYFVKDPKQFTFNSLDVRVPSARQIVYGDKRADPDGRVPDDTWMIAPVLPPDVPTRDGFILRPQDIPERFPVGSDTWFFSRVAGTFKERQGFHGCQMPEQLLGRIIRACSDARDIVLDPFGGSGTTPAVAKKLNRRFVAIELSEDYVTKIHNRLDGINPGDQLDGPEDAARSAPPTKKGRRVRQGSSRIRAEASQSPIMTRANASLGQVAVANAEYATAIAEAFMAAHEGYSADRVLADPKLNDKFLDNCRLLGIPGDTANWNHLLLNIRKRGGLSAIETSRRTIIRRSEMGPFLIASEIAWRKVSDDHHCSLDDILCDPLLSERFERVASRVVPGYSSFEYRWAALSVRKDASQGNGLLKAVGESFVRLRRTEFDRLRECPGHYLVRVADKPFFVGYTDSLRSCRLFERQCLDAALDTMGIKARSEHDIEIGIRKFDYSALSKVVKKARLVEWKAACRASLLLRYDPCANVRFFSFAA